MRSYRWFNAGCLCPFYKEQDQQHIYCGGTEKGIVYHVAFATPKMLKEYQKEFCKTSKGCPMSKALEEYWESKE